RGALWLRRREVFDDVRRYQEARGDYERNALRSLGLSRVHLEAMVPVVAGELPLVLEAHRASDLLAAIRFAEAEGIRLVLAGGAEAHLVARELAAAKVPLLLRPSAQEPWSFDALRVRDDCAARLEAAGVHLVLTAGGGWDQNARRLRQEAGLAVAHGLPREAALVAITSRAAAAFGKAAEVGTVEVGKRANLVLWSGDPLELSTVAERVFIDGKELTLENRQLELARRYLQRTE
ncbi:MAG: amidohydrolase family protein, partial [Myxococcota bacterium]